MLGTEDLIEGHLVRTNAPRTVEKILLKFPLTGKVTNQGNQLNMVVNIKMGKEKSVEIAKKGEIGYWPLNDALSIFLEDTKPYGGINIIGHITSNLDALMNLRMGTTLKIAQTSKPLQASK